MNANERRGRARWARRSTGAWLAGALSIVCASASARAQQSTEREPPPRESAPSTTDSEPPSRATRVALGAAAALGVATVTMGLSAGITGSFSSSSSTSWIVGSSVGAVITLGLAPLGYVLAGDATGGRGRYWAALVGWVGGAALGFVALPIQLSTAPFSNNTGLIIAVSALTPLLGLAGMAIGYELSHDAHDEPGAGERSIAHRARVRWAPSIAFDGRAMSLAIGGSL